MRVGVRESERGSAAVALKGIGQGVWRGQYARVKIILVRVPQGTWKMWKVFVVFMRIDYLQDGNWIEVYYSRQTC